jgi:alpha-1,2-mannosyltransferase
LNVFSLVIFSLSLAALATLVCMNTRVFWLQTDAVVYRDAGASLWGHDGRLYKTAFGPARLPYTYTPFAAVLFSAGSHLPFDGWKLVLAVADLALLLSAVTGALKLSGSRNVASRALLAAAACLWLEPIDMTFHFGQINLLIVALVVLDFSGGSRGPWQGIGVGMAAGVKLTPLIFIPYLWLIGRRREACGSLGFFAATTVLGLVLRPRDSADFWSGALFRAGDDPTRIQDQSINGFLRRLSPHGIAVELAWVALAVLVGVAGIAVAVRAHRAGLALTGLTACAATGLAVSPLSWTHHYAYVLLPVSLALSSELPRRPRAALGVLALALFAWWPWPNGGDWRALKFHVSGLLRLVPYGPGRELRWGVRDTIAGNYYLWGVVAFLAYAHWMTCEHQRRQPAQADGSQELRIAATLT